ncbi:hypothetical protein N9997_02345 [Synechococcus sp. AH-603-L18]|nr:hypothetical protein [Synechococcus sp. AH-603-L18]MDB4338163.1 hypothetical protein [Synechococcus sp. AH-603-L18]
MTTQTLELQAVTDDELIAVNGGGFAGALAKGIGKVAKSGFKFGRNTLAYEAAGQIVDGAING